MCLSKYSNLEHLREVAMNLYSSEDHGNMNELCERELATLINTYYQESEVVTSGDKRKNVVVTCGVNKKFKVLNEVSVILSALELLPNEVYEMILKHLGGQDKKNLRITSIGLYHKTSLLAPMFHDWCFEATRGTQPDFILTADKNFHLKEMIISPQVDPFSNLINRFSHRIASIQIRKEGVLMNYLNKSPDKFSQITSIDLENVFFNSSSLLLLAPQLEHLKLTHMKKAWFDISAVNEESKCFTKLKTLELVDINIDVKKILTKCCNTLDYLKLTPLRPIDDLKYLENELSILQNIYIDLNYDDSEQPLSNLLSKCSRSLKTLNLKANKIDMSHLLEQDMKITSLKIYTPNPRKKSSIEEFLNKCPLLQKLTLTGYNKEINGIVLKDLNYLRLDYCGSKCMTSLLEHTSKYSLRTVDITQESDVLTMCKFPVISKLDKLLLHEFCNGSEDMKNQALGRIVKMFPSDVKVVTEKLRSQTVFRRVYGLH